MDDWDMQNGVLLLGKTEAAWARMQVLQPTPNGG